jgi:superfamily II DNA or RNA helicase
MAGNYISTPVTQTGKLVFAIRFHDFLGVVISPYLVQEISNGEFSYSSRQLNSQTLADYFNCCSESEKKVVGFLDECRDEELMKTFSKKAKTVAGFYNEQTECRIKTLVIPYVQKRIDRSLRILMDAEIPVYFKGRRNDPVVSSPIAVRKKEAKAVFNFIKHENESHYFLTLEHLQKEISLKSPSSQVLVNSPGWILAGNNIYLLEEGIDGNKVKPFFTKDHVVIPAAAEEKYFKTFVINAIRNFKVRAEGFQLSLEAPPCIPVLRLENDLEANPVLILYFMYERKKCLPTDRNSCWVELKRNDTYSFRKLIRDTDAENRFMSLLGERGLSSNDRSVFRLESTHDRDEPSSGNQDSLYALVEWLKHYSAELESDGFELQQGFLREDYFTGTSMIEIDMYDNNDWFGIHAFAVFGDFKIPFIKLKSHLLSGNREYILPDGKVAILPAEWFSEYKNLILWGKPDGDSILLGKHHFTLAENIMNGKNIPGELQNLGEKDKLPVPEVPGELSGILRPYQLAGYAWMYLLHKNRLGGCLADDMGLGKTLQTLALLSKIKKENTPGPTSLIVMPLSLIHNWENEIRKFTPGLTHIKYTGNNREALSENLGVYDIVLTTYGVVRNDVDFLKSFNFFYLILDESQIIKNPKSKIYKAIRMLKSDNRLVLTGTPIENSLTDLWAQLTFLNPGILGSRHFFQEEFVNPIEKLNDDDAKGGLRKLIEPFILRRTKMVVEKDLPELSEKVYYCEMSEDQKSLYDKKKSEIRNAIFKQIDSGTRGNLRIDVLRGLMQLRMMANHPLLTACMNEESGKFEEVIRNIENLMAEGHKLLIFSQFVRHLLIYREYFDRQGWKYSFLTGKVGESDRKDVISEFQDDPDNLLFLISLRAGGVGLNLTAADYVFILDPWWNPAVEKQAVSRAHRIGQKRNVFSYKFITKDTVEEKILSLQQKKAGLAGEFININNPLKLFTDDEIMGLFE